MLRLPSIAALPPALALAATVLCAQDVRAAPEWIGDLETGDLSQWVLGFSNLGNADGISVVEDPVFEGQFAARVVLAPEDVAPGGLTRNELEYSPDPTTFEDSERYYAIALQAGSEQAWGNDWHSMWYWEGNPVFAPVMTLNALGPQFQFRTFLGTEQELWTGPFTPGQWHEFVLHVRWSADPSVGFVELYYGGDLVVPMTPVQTMHAAGVPNFMHAGILRSENIGVTEVLYIDGVRAGATLQDVMPGADGGSDTGDTGAADSGDAPADDTGAGQTAGGPDTGDSADGAIDDTAGTTASAATGSDATGDPAAGGDDTQGGCGCTTTTTTTAPAGLALLLLPLVRRRHRRGRA